MVVTTANTETSTLRLLRTVTHRSGVELEAICQHGTGFGRNFNVDDNGVDVVIESAALPALAAEFHLADDQDPMGSERCPLNAHTFINLQLSFRSANSSPVAVRR